MPASIVTLQAVYADTFLVVAKVGGEGGSVSAESESERVVENEPATIQIQPARGYLVNLITFDTCGTGSLSGLTFTMDDRPDETFRSRFQ